MKDLVASGKLNALILYEEIPPLSRKIEQLNFAFFSSANICLPKVFVSLRLEN